MARLTIIHNKKQTRAIKKILKQNKALTIGLCQGGSWEFKNNQKRKIDKALLQVGVTTYTWD